MSKRPKRVLCALIQELPGVPRVDSFVDECERCHKAVWRAKSSDADARAICRHCVEPDLKAGKARVQPPSQAQIDDIRKARALGVLDDDE